jgi:hypothetical protein
MPKMIKPTMVNTLIELKTCERQICFGPCLNLPEPELCLAKGDQIVFKLRVTSVAYPNCNKLAKGGRTVDGRQMITYAACTHHVDADNRHQ